MAEHDGRLVTKDALFSTVWDGTIVSESALTSAIKELRRALGDESRTPRYIESVYGRGYRLIAPVQAVTAEAHATPAGPRIQQTPPRKSSEAADGTTEGQPPLVLVSAFRDEAVRERHPWCGEELREEVLSGLARFREIQLVSDNRPEDVVAASRGSDRGYQLTATLLPEAEGVKVIARTKRLTDGRIVWAETLSLANTTTAGGVEQIVRRIIGAALPAVDEDLFLALPHETDDFYDNYLIAKRHSFVARSFGEAKAAAAALEDLIADRPDFGLAYPPLVRLYNTDYGFTGLGSCGPDERDRALELARAGLAADRGNVHAYTVLGFCHLRHGQRDLARECLERAQALNPYNPVRLNEVATGLMWLGEFGEARRLYDYSLSLQPFADDLLFEDLSQLCLLENKPEEALTHVRKMSAQRLWSSLYEALGESMVGVPPKDSKLPAWRDWVTARWHRRPGPSQDELEMWIAVHHPLADEPKAAFRDLVRECFAAADGQEPAPRPRASSLGPTLR
ncbi:MAG: winged helix-turn-helix domain-containing protein [Allosphingosinicella sp.]